MPEQAPYPETPWWQQAQAQDQAVGQMTSEEFNEWFRGKPEGSRLLYDKGSKLDKAIEEHPDGFVVHKQHPGLKSIEGSVDLYNMPEEGLGRDWYMAKPKPKAPLVS